MNDQEARNLAEKIMHADKVIHLQQLSIAWKPPSDPFFAFLSESNAAAGDSSYKGADSATQGNSVMNQNTSIMDSQGGANQAQSKSELVDDQSVVTGNAHDIRDKYEKIKNVFKILIQECPYLIDDKAYEKCEGRSLKEQFSIKIDSIRKSLGIEAMQDVELLVDVLYSFQAYHDKEMEIQKAKWAAEDEEESGLPAENQPNPPADEKKPANGDDANKDEEEGEKDPNKLDLDLTLLVKGLQKFHKDREDIALQKGMLNVGKQKKKEKFADKAADAEREKKKQKLYWERMTTILNDQKRSVWGALDKALAKYYQMLVDRQNLIEETGLLNQQNEELKTLLNQYLQAGVNQELQVPPTQVIRLDI